MNPKNATFHQAQWLFQHVQIQVLGSFFLQKFRDARWKHLWYNRAIKCKECKGETNQIKAGKQGRKTQKYRCKICGKYYAHKGKKREYSKEIKKLAIKLYKEGNSGRVVGRVMGIDKNMCLHWVRKFAKDIEPKETSNARLILSKWTSCIASLREKKQNLCDNADK